MLAAGLMAWARGDTESLEFELAVHRVARLINAIDATLTSKPRG